jgi:hypothetical protein
MQQRLVFDADSSAFNRRMAEGHAVRCGHALAGYYTSTATAGVFALVRTCCATEKGYRP